MNKTIVAGGAVGLALLLISTQAFAQSYTAADVAAHGQSNDCWVTISGKVYDMSAFLNQHPGGRSSIIAYCGKDATTAFATKGGGGSHSSFAYSLLPGYFVGDMSAATNSQSSTPAPQVTPPTPSPAVQQEKQHATTVDQTTSIHESSISHDEDDSGDLSDDDFEDDDEGDDAGWHAAAQTSISLGLHVRGDDRHDEGDDD